MKVKKTFQNLFKAFFQNIFKILYGKIIYEKNEKNKNVDISVINNPEIITFFKKKYKVMKIKKGRIYNDNVQNVAIINKNLILNEVSYQQLNGELKGAENNICLKIGTPRVKKKVNGRVLNLAQGASGHNNYSHWLLDMLPKLKLYEEIFDFDDLEYIYLNKLNDYQKKTIDLLGLKNVKIIDSNRYRHLECKELIATHHPSYFEGFILDQAQFVPKWIIEWLRKSFLDKSEKINLGDKIFIDRSSSTFEHCQIINLDETIEFLKNQGFESVKLENLTFQQQVFLFKKAKIIVGAHGAGLSNLSFCQRNCKVIEMRPSKPGYGYQNKVYERISEINDLDYKLYSTDFIEEKKKVDGDIEVNLKILNDYLNRVRNI
tara:strand:+ start:83 stop:1207 length:1125 start_codon:yes stop_codon:yes gene_type:complete